MGQLWTDLKTFYDNELLVQLTNANLPGNTTINETVGLKAEQVATAIFKREVGITPDFTNASHEAPAFELIVYLLRQWANKLGETWSKVKDTVYADLKALRETDGARPRVTATTSSPDDPTDDTRDGAISNPKPNFDLTRFDGISPNAPAGPMPSSFPNPFPL